MSSKSATKCTKKSSSCDDGGNPCESIAFPTLPMQMYTIADDAEVFTYPDISTAECVFDYTYVTSPTSAGVAISFDGSNQQFSVFYDDDLDLSGGTVTDFIDYTITITATINDATGVTTDGSFTL